MAIQVELLVTPDQRDRMLQAVRDAHGSFANMEAPCRYVAEAYLSAFNAALSVPARDAGTALVPWISASPDDIPCELCPRELSDNRPGGKPIAKQMNEAA